MSSWVAEWTTEQKKVQKHHRSSNHLTQTSSSLGAEAFIDLGHLVSQGLEAFLNMDSQ